MKGNILGEPFEQYVFDQIKERQKLQGSGLETNRTTEQINYLSNRNTWIKLASGVSIMSGNLGHDRIKEVGFTDNQLPTFDGEGLAKNAVLFNSTSKANFDANGKFTGYTERKGIRSNYNNGSPFDEDGVYSLGSKEFGFQPVPGIISAEVDCINRGSIRTANVMIHAHNKFQFELIELLYLRLGYSMMLEWGWNEYVDKGGVIKKVGNTIIEDFWFTKNNITQSYMLAEIEKKRKDYSGNYEGFFGKVSNFEWNLTNEGVYVINLKLITVGGVIESLTANIPNDRYSIARNSDTKEDSSNVRINELQDSLITENSSTNAIVYWLYEKIELWDQDQQGVNTVLRNKNPFYQTNFEALSKGATNVTNSKFSYYINLAEFLTVLSGLMMPVIKNGDSFENMLEIDTERETNLLYLEDKVVPIDPRVCIFNFQGIKVDPSFLDKQTTYLPPTTYGESMEDLNKNLNVSLKGNRVHYLMDLYLNFEFLANISTKVTNREGEINLFKFLKRICDGINDSFGNYTKLEPIIKDDRIITIIDQKTIPLTLKTKSDSPQLEIYGYNKTDGTSNFIKNINFNTKITPALASQISIGATAGNSTSSIIEGTAFSRWNIGLVDRFSKEIEKSPYNPPSKKEQETQQGVSESFWVKSSVGDPLVIRGTFDSTIKKFEGGGSYERRNIKYKGNSYLLTEKEWSKKYKEITEAEAKKQAENSSKNFLHLKSWDSYLQQLIGPRSEYFKYNPSFIQRGKSLFRKYIIKKGNEDFKQNKNASNLIGFIPITLDLTIEGISGIKIYQKLNIKQKILPYQYSESFNFLITKVNHKIENNSWDTVLSTLSTSNIEELPPSKNITPDIIKREVFKGETPNADALRGMLKTLNFSEKKIGGVGEISSNGDISRSMLGISTLAFALIRNKYPLKFPAPPDEIQIEITGGNDLYHSLDTNSSHYYGRGIDFTVKPSKYIDEVEQILKGNNILYLNEYKVKTERATAGHFHIYVK